MTVGQLVALLARYAEMAARLGSPESAEAASKLGNTLAPAEKLTVEELVRQLRASPVFRRSRQ